MQGIKVYLERTVLMRISTKCPRLKIRPSVIHRLKQAHNNSSCVSRPSNRDIKPGTGLELSGLVCAKACLGQVIV